MDKEEMTFRRIAEKLAEQNKDVQLGKMMSSPGIKYKNKVFAFYYDQEMVFRLGKDFDPKKHGIENYSLLSPFKNKPPMAGWFQIPSEHKRTWEKLAKLALQKMVEELERK